MVLIELNPGTRAYHKARRIERDCNTLLAAPNTHPIPMKTAPWYGGPRDFAILIPGDRPWSVHTFTHFEAFVSVGALLERWVIDEQQYFEDRATKEGQNADHGDRV